MRYSKSEDNIFRKKLTKAWVTAVQVRETIHISIIQLKDIPAGKITHQFRIRENQGTSYMHKHSETSIYITIIYSNTQ